jgi:hypothetical protein
LSAGELGGIADGVGAAQSHDVEQFGDARIDAALVEPVGPQGFREELEHRQPRVQRRDRVLEHDLDVAS